MEERVHQKEIDHVFFTPHTTQNLTGDMRENNASKLIVAKNASQPGLSVYPREREYLTD